MRRAAGLLLRLGAVSSLVVCLGASSATAQWFGSRRARVTEASIRGHMEMLASDAMNGRGSGTRDEWLAAVYIGRPKYYALVNTRAVNLSLQYGNNAESCEAYSGYAIILISRFGDASARSFT